MAADPCRQPPADSEPENKGSPSPSSQPPAPQIQSQDPTNPVNWSATRKWGICLIACYVTFIVGLNATALTSASKEINTAFGISDERFPNSFWPLTAWNTGAAFAPMVVLPIMEDYGFRPGYLVVYTIFAIFTIPQALAQNFETLIITRFFAGCCGGVLQDAMDGIIADMWDSPVGISRPVSCYVFALLSGLSIGPVIGGAIGGSHWRWIFYVQLIIYGVSLPIVFFIFHETRYPVILSSRMKRSRKQTASGTGIARITSSIDHNDAQKCLTTFLRKNILRPFILLTTEPVVFFFTLLSALSYGLLFFATQSVPQVYEALYAFTEAQAGLVQASIVVGEVLGLICCLFIGDVHFAKAYAKSTSTHGPENLQLPEVRLHLAIPSCFLGLVGGLFIYGWTSYANVTYWAPSVGLLLVGFGSTVVMQAIMVYITDAYASYAASASAAVCMGENLFAAFLPLASQSMYTTLGFQWASSLLAFLALALSVAPVILLWKGRSIREKSTFMTATC